MSDITASTALRDYIAGHLQGSYYFATLHTATTGITASSIYASTGLSEVPTDSIYTLGGQEVVSTEVDGVIDTGDAVWTTADGTSLTAEACCLWVNDTQTITGAKLVSMKEATVTGSGAGGSLTATFVNPITIPTGVVA